MKWWRALRRRFGISAPQVAIRAHLPWYWRWLSLCLTGLLLVGMGIWFYDQTLDGLGRDERTELHALRTELPALKAKLADAQARAVAAERQLQIEKSAATHLTDQIKKLQGSNLDLKEQVAFFESMLSADNRNRSLNIFRFFVEKDGAPGVFRYRALLMQGSAQNVNFLGRYEIVVQLQDKNGRLEQRVFPAAGDRDAATYLLDFKSHHRIERLFHVAPDMQLKGAHLRVYEQSGTQPKIIEAATLGG